MKYLFLSIFILVLSFLGISKPLEDGGGFVLNSLSVPFRYTALQLEDYSFFLINIRDIYDENQILKKQVLELQSQTALLDQIKKENQALKDQFLEAVPQDFTDSNNEEMLLVTVVGNPEDMTNSTVYINAGSNNGVKQKSMVIYKNYLVGQVISVEEYRSLVALLYSPDLRVSVTRAISLSEFAAECENSSEPIDLSENSTSTEGIVTGDFGTSLKLERVLQKETLNKGDFLLTSGREGNFKPGYIVGKVGEIYAEPTKPLKSAQVLPLLDIERLNKAFVFVERSKE